jgi:prophage regulatory protein
MSGFKIVRAKQLPSITGLSLPTIYRLVKKGEFPAQIRLSTQAVGWDTRDIESWLESRRALPALA